MPDEFAPLVLIEAKISEDDGAARDGVSRVEKLALVIADWVKAATSVRGNRRIAGRGFGSDGNYDADQTAINARLTLVPEPSSLVLLGVGAAVTLSFSVWRRRA